MKKIESKFLNYSSKIKVVLTILSMENKVKHWKELLSSFVKIMILLKTSENNQNSMNKINYLKLKKLLYLKFILTTLAYLVNKPFLRHNYQKYYNKYKLILILKTFMDKTNRTRIILQKSLIKTDDNWKYLLIY